MEFRTLTYFLMVAREENITKAAQLLHITQPTLSRQLMQLEEELGVKLFKRSSHNIVLTEEGMLLKRRAQELVSLAEKTKQDLRQSEQELNGEITIGSGEFLSMDYFSRLLKAFRKQHPKVRFHFYSGNANAIRERIEMGLLDIGLLFQVSDIRKYEIITIPIQEEWGILTPNSSELAKKKSILMEDLLGKELILPERFFQFKEFAEWFQGQIDTLKVVATFNLLYNGAIMVRNELGHAICIKLNATYEGLTFVPLFPTIQANSIMAWKKGQVLSPTLEVFLEFAKKYIQGIS
jgi:DNA-binding transcriptional LysR family regulator